MHKHAYAFMLVLPACWWVALAGRPTTDATGVATFLPCLGGVVQVVVPRWCQVVHLPDDDAMGGWAASFGPSSPSL